VRYHAERGNESGGLLVMRSVRTCVTTRSVGTRKGKDPTLPCSKLSGKAYLPKPSTSFFTSPAPRSLTRP
jgi:hypothetical protein